jgi:hypothetical protein
VCLGLCEPTGKQKWKLGELIILVSARGRGDATRERQKKARERQGALVLWTLPWAFHSDSSAQCIVRKTMLEIYISFVGIRMYVCFMV